MPFKPTEKIWHNGVMIPWEKATLHVTSHVANYGSAVFEGVRYYSLPAGPAIFRLKEHAKRLFDSAKVYRMEIPYTLEQVMDAMCQTVRENGLRDGYLRPIVLRGYGEVGINPLNSPVEVYVVTWEWGKYLGAEALEQGVDACVSSWARMAPNTLPAIAKAAGNYLNSELIKMEAVLNGYAEGIALDSHGLVSEGSGQNIFLVRDGALYTPPVGASILPGITRDAVIQMAGDLGITVIERNIPREWLYLSDELFFCGTAVEITPIRTVDRIKVGGGSRGPVTRRLQEEFFGLLSGVRPDRHRWLTVVPAKTPAAFAEPALR
jgi:branched-chain amino acid aminotransferase